MQHNFAVPNDRQAGAATSPGTRSCVPPRGGHARQRHSQVHARKTQKSMKKACSVAAVGGQEKQCVGPRAGGRRITAVLRRSVTSGLVSPSRPVSSQARRVIGIVACCNKGAYPVHTKTLAHTHHANGCLLPYLIAGGSSTCPGPTQGSRKLALDHGVCGPPENLAGLTMPGTLQRAARRVQWLPQKRMRMAALDVSYS